MFWSCYDFSFNFAVHSFWNLFFIVSFFSFSLFPHLRFCFLLLLFSAPCRGAPPLRKNLPKSTFHNKKRVPFQTSVCSLFSSFVRTPGCFSPSSMFFHFCFCCHFSITFICFCTSFISFLSFLPNSFRFCAHPPRVEFRSQRSTHPQKVKALGGWVVACGWQLKVRAKRATFSRCAQGRAARPRSPVSPRSFRPRLQSTLSVWSEGRWAAWAAPWDAWASP